MSEIEVITLGFIMCLPLLKRWPWGRRASQAAVTTFDPIILDHAAAEAVDLTGSINALIDEAAGSDDPAAIVLVIAVLEAERDWLSGS